MKIAFTAKGNDWDSKIDPRFGRTEHILVYDDENDELTHYDNREIEKVAHGAGPRTAQKLFEFKPDVLITGNGPGGNAARVLNEAGMKIFTCAEDMSVKESLKAYYNGDLQLFKN